MLWRKVLVKEVFKMFILEEKVCETCGKTFYPCPDHVFKRFGMKKGKRTLLYFHIYSCMVAYDKKHPKACSVQSQY